MLSIVNTLKEFSYDELKRFQKFLDSPYHNKSNKVKVLFNEIKKFYPSFSNKNLTKDHLSGKVSPSLNYNDSTFRNLMADLQSQLEHFLIHEQVYKSEHDKNIMLLKALIDKKNDAVFDLQLKKGFDLLQRDGIDGKNYYFQSRLELCKFNYSGINKFEKSVKNIEGQGSMILNYVVSLISFVVSEIINAHLRLTVQEFKFKVKDKTLFTSKLLDAMNVRELALLIKSVDKSNFILELYYNLFLLFQNIADKQYYLNYRALISKFFNKLSKDELAYHYSMLMNYCIIHNSFNENKTFYDNELFTIYNTFLKEELFIDKKSSYLSEDLFRNILVLSLKLTRFEWVNNFISAYSKYLHPEKRKNMINLSFAQYYYHLGSHKNSNEYLNLAFNYLKKIKEETFILKYDIKILYLMLYYDLGYIDNLLCLLKNYRQFLCRNNLVPLRRKQKLNKFLNILEKLAHLKEGNPKIDIITVEAEIMKLKNFNYQEWLLSKAQLFKEETPYKLKLG